jgi:adenylate kinase family enzyme
VSISEAILQAIEAETSLGLKAQECLLQGEAVSNDLALQILTEKLNSPEIHHHGYILDDFPTSAQEFLSVNDQIEFINNLQLKPDYIINIKIPDQDLFERSSKVKVDPYTYAQPDLDPES